MMAFTPSMKYHLYGSPTDMRKGFREIGYFGVTMPLLSVERFHLKDAAIL